MSPADADGDLDLSGTWRAGIADEELRRTWYADDFDDTGFTDIDVPGHWRNRATFADNDEPLLYRRRFTTLTPTPGTRAWLLLDGVCSQGDVWLDGSYLGDTDGAWVPHAFEVTDALADRNDHVVGIEVASPPLGDRASKRGLLGTLQDGPYVRPGWNPGGIWRPVTIRRTGPVAVVDHRVLCTSATATRAVVTITCTLDSTTARSVTLTTRTAGVDHEHVQPLARGHNTVTWTVAVPNPELWWPRELGDQPLSDVTVDVCLPTVDDADPHADGHDHDRSLVVSDRFTARLGLRQVALRDWILTVNGERLFLKGVLAGPAAPDLATAPVDTVTAPVRLAAELGCNLVRVHAHVARDELYDAADRAGMLIWQDLPLYRGQNRSVRRTAVRTARAVVDRLGAHPSIAIWCGHDEPDHIEGDGRPVGFGRRLAAHELPNWNRSVLDRSVKRALTAADPSRPVIGSSGTWPHPPSLAGTDTHLELGWTGGDPDDLARIARTVPRAVRFVQLTPSPSAAAPPADHVTATWPAVEPDDLVGDGPVDADLLVTHLPPAAFATADDWHRATNGLQAQLLRTQIETLRRLKYRPTGGIVVAHLADLHPVTAPSLFDHTGDPKPAAAAVRTAFAPVLATLSPWPGCLHPGDTLACEVHLVNDTREPLTDARCEVHLGWDDGDERWVFAGDIDADAVALVGRIRLGVPDGATRVTAEVRVQTPGLATTSQATVPVHTDHH